MTRMMTNIEKFRALSFARQRIVLKAAILLPFFRSGLHLVGLRRIQGWLGRATLPAGAPLSLEEAKDMGNLVNIASRHTLGSVTCLTRSLLLDWMLHRLGVASQLRIGVHITQGALDAHAWVEVAGVPVNDQPNIGEQFAPFENIPPPGAFHSP